MTAPNKRYHAVRRTTVVNASINTALAILKIVLGAIGHSQALVADGIHSFSDLITDGIVLMASKMGTQQPDKEHPYGHRRIETIGTIVIALLLAIIAIGIAYDTLHHIIDHTPTEKPTYIVIIVAVISIFANEFLYHYTMYEGNQIDSDLLRSNAWHNRSDALISIIVLISVIGDMLGAHYLDAIGALIIAILILKMAIKMVWSSTKELIDTAIDETLLQQISSHILTIPGVNSIHQLRTRSHGNHIILDVHIEVDPYISISEGHYISEQVNINLIKTFSRITDVTVHIDPENDQRFMLSKNLPDRKTILDLLQQRWEKLAHQHKIEKILLHYLNGKIDIEVSLPQSLLEIFQRDQKALQQQYQHAIEDVNYINSLTFYFS